MFVRGLFPIPFMNADGGQAGGGTNDGGQGQAGSQGQQGQDPNAGQQGNDGSQKGNEHMIPKTRFDEVNNSLKELQKKLDDIEKEKEQAALDAKKKNGEFEELYKTTSTELDTTKTQFEQTSARVEQLEGLIQNLVDAELESVPEELRDLVPENMSPEQKLSWITNAKKKGLFGAAPNKADEPLGGSTNKGNPQDKLDLTKMSIAEMLKSAYGSKK